MCAIYNTDDAICLFLPNYRAMQFTAKLGIVIACRPSVCPSVMLVDQDHIGNLGN